MNVGIINSVKMTQQIDKIKFVSRRKVHIPWMSGQPRGCTHFFGWYNSCTIHEQITNIIIQAKCLFDLILSKLGENP